MAHIYAKIYFTTWQIQISKHYYYITSFSHLVTLKDYICRNYIYAETLLDLNSLGFPKSSIHM